MITINLVEARLMSRKIGWAIGANRTCRSWTSPSSRFHLRRCMTSQTRVKPDSRASRAWLPAQRNWGNSHSWEARNTSAWRTSSLQRHPWTTLMSASRTRCSRCSGCPTPWACGTWSRKVSRKRRMQQQLGVQREAMLERAAAHPHSATSFIWPSWHKWRSWRKLRSSSEWLRFRRVCKLLMLKHRLIRPKVKWPCLVSWEAHWPCNIRLSSSMAPSRCLNPNLIWCHPSKSTPTSSHPNSHRHTYRPCNFSTSSSETDWRACIAPSKSSSRRGFFRLRLVTIWLPHGSRWWPRSAEAFHLLITLPLTHRSTDNHIDMSKFRNASEWKGQEMDLAKSESIFIIVYYLKYLKSVKEMLIRLLSNKLN